MRGGVQLRGEWLFGRPFDHVSTAGGYFDLTVHRRAMGPVTAVGRIERLDYAAGPFSSYPRRATIGANVRFTRFLSGELNAIHELGAPASFTGRRTQLDAGLTCTVRF